VKPTTHTGPLNSLAVYIVIAVGLLAFFFGTVTTGGFLVFMIVFVLAVFAATIMLKRLWHRLVGVR
jgi:hypothetical protein